MNCVQVETRMVDYLSRDLPPAEIELVESHLHECAACSRDLAQLRQSDALLRRTSADAASPGSVDVLAIVNRTTRRLERSRQRWRRISAAALAAALLLVLFNSLSLTVEIHDSHIVLGWGERKPSALPVETSNVSQVLAQFNDHKTRLDDLDELILVLIQRETADEQQHTRETISLAKRLYSMQEQNNTRWKTLTSTMRRMPGWPPTNSTQYTSYVGEEQ